MKVATLTLPLHTNYGGVIQAYALQKILLGLNCDTKLIKIEDSIYRNPLLVLASKLKNKVLFKNTISNLNFKTFIDNEIVCTSRICYKYQLKSKEVSRFDAYIVGSDQVWRPDYANDISLYYFDFIKNDNKILLSYAASFGCDNWNYSLKDGNICTSLLKRFKAISVRENSGVSIVKNKLNKKAIRLLDPTLILDVKYYNDIINKYTTNDDSNKGVFCYILDQNKEKEKIIKKISTILSLNYLIFNEKYDDCEKLGLGDWLKGFRDSDYIITDSFHGVAFSIIYNKKFIAIGNPERGLSRFKNILKIFNLDDRLISNSNELDINIIHKDIDYDYIKQILNEEKNKSLTFLLSNLGIKDGK